jgi:hypothetical protein
MSRYRLLAVVAVAVLVWPGEIGARPRTLQETTRDLARQEQKIRRGQSVVRRLLRDPRTSPDVRQHATELQTALEARARAMSRLENAHKQFLARHQAELQELEDLRKRAFEVDERLNADRRATLDASANDLEDLNRNSERALELIEQLRGAQGRARRDRHPR